MAEHQLRLDKDTQNKLRWNGYVSGVSFKLYLPNHVVPEPTPKLIYVSMEHGPIVEQPTYERRDENGLRASAEFFEEHTETVRYRPVGESRNWIIGEPYIPKAALPDSWPVRLGIVVRWG